MKATSRYARQERLADFGTAAQQNLAAATVSVLGLGALGTVAAELLARAGVGNLRLIDRDIVELSNLHRQLLYTESDAHHGLPKAEAAATRLSSINSTINLQPCVADVTPNTIHDLLAGSTAVVDATDNAQTRFLLNDWCVKQGVPWVYGAGLGWEGRTLGIVPKPLLGATACLRCVFHDIPPPGSLDTCETAGVLPAVTATVASLQAGFILRLLAGISADGTMTAINLRSGRITQVATGEPDVLCKCCSLREFDLLHGVAVEDGAKLCGRDTVQIRLGSPLDLATLAARHPTIASRSKFMVRLSAGEATLTCFADGRVLVAGVKDIASARAAVARWIGV